MYSEKKTEDISKLVSKSVLARENTVEQIPNTSLEKNSIENKRFDEFHSKYRTENKNETKSRIEENYAKSRLESREAEEYNMRNKGFEENFTQSRGFDENRDFNKDDQSEIGKKTYNYEKENNQSENRSFLLERERSRLEENNRKNAEFTVKYEEILRQKQGKKEETNRENDQKYENRVDEGAKYKEIIKKYIKKSSQGEKKGFVFDDNNKINKYESIFLIGKNDENKVKFSTIFYNLIHY